MYHILSDVCVHEELLRLQGTLLNEFLLLLLFPPVVGVNDAEEDRTQGCLHGLMDADSKQSEGLQPVRVNHANLFL